MQAIKQAAFLRPISRSSSPAPTAKLASGSPEPTDVPLDLPVVRTSSKGPLNRLSFGSLRGRPPVPAPLVQVAVPHNTLVQDGGYLEALSLKISEAIAKALAVPPNTVATADDSFNNRRAIPAGRGTALGNVFLAELSAAKENSQLYKAIIRQLHRPLSVLLTNVSAQLLPVLSSPSFQVCDPNGHNAAQLHALAIAGFASELMKCFDQGGLGKNNFSESRSDGLQGIREGFEGVVTRVLTPLSSALKHDILPIIADLEKRSADAASVVSPSNKNPFLKIGPANQTFHPAIYQLQTRLPAYAKYLQRYSSIGGKAYEPQLAGLIIGFIWRALVSLAHRKPKPATSSRPTTPASGGQKKRISPPTTPRIGLAFMGSMTGSRPPSPTSVLPISQAADTKAVYDLIQTLPRPAQENVDACEAIDEGFDDLRALTSLLESLEATSNLGDADIWLLTEELPALIVLPILLSSRRQQDREPSDEVWELLDLEEQEYRKTCLASFGREEECAETVLRKVLEVISLRNEGQCTIARWIRTWLESE